MNTATLTTTDILKECFGAWATDEDVYSTEEWMNDVEDMCKGKVDFITEFL